MATQYGTSPSQPAKSEFILWGAESSNATGGGLRHGAGTSGFKNAYARRFLAGSFKFREYLQQETTKSDFFCADLYNGSS